MNTFLLGAVALASLIAALFFLRFWKKTHDRFFLFFAAAFTADAFNRTIMAITEPLKEDEPFLYLIRLATFILILVAILDKNRKKKAVESVSSNTKRPAPL